MAHPQQPDKPIDRVGAGLDDGQQDTGITETGTAPGLMPEKPGCQPTGWIPRTFQRRHGFRPHGSRTPISFEGRLPVVLFGHEQVVRLAQKADVCWAMTTSATEGVDVMELQPIPF